MARREIPKPVLHDITTQQQLDNWVAGTSLHRIADGLKDGECCPDFSCCMPTLLAPLEVRQAFAAGGDAIRGKFLGVFLGAMLKHAMPDDDAPKIHVAGQFEPGGES